MAGERTILLLGGSGQIGTALREQLHGRARVLAPPSADVDLRDSASLRRALHASDPAVVINAAAYTAVDRAERETDDAFAINAHAPGVLAEECARDGRWLVQLSTDYVFDGEAEHPYTETDAPAPLNVYGASKLAGERAVEGAGGPHLIVRTSWVYSAGGRNFVEAIRRLARERERLEVVDDQRGAPTSARAVARAIVTMIDDVLDAPRGAGPRPGGTFHVTASGSTTWYDFAQRILADDPARSAHRCTEIARVSSEAFGAPARRPRWSVLDNERLHARFGVRLPSWDALWREELPFFR